MRLSSLLCCTFLLELDSEGPAELHAADVLIEPDAEPVTNGASEIVNFLVDGVFSLGEGSFNQGSEASTPGGKSTLSN